MTVTVCMARAKVSRCGPSPAEEGSFTPPHFLFSLPTTLSRIQHGVKRNKDTIYCK